MSSGVPVRPRHGAGEHAVTAMTVPPEHGAHARVAYLGERVRVVIPVNASPEVQNPVIRDLPWRTRLLVWFAARPTLAGGAFAAMAKDPRNVPTSRLVGAQERRFLRDEHLSDMFVAMLTEGLRGCLSRRRAGFMRAGQACFGWCSSPAASNGFR